MLEYCMVSIPIKKWINSGDNRTVLIKKNIIGSFFVKILNIVIQLILVPTVLGFVSSKVYGIWLILSTFLIWLNFFDIGFSLGLKNKLAEAIANKDFILGKKLVSSTYIIIACIFIPLSIIALILVPHIKWFSLFNVEESYNNSIINSLYIIIAFFSLQIILQTITSVISAYQKVALSSVISMVGNLLALLIIYLQTKFFSPSLELLAISLASMQVFSLFIFSFYLYKKKFKEIAPSIKFFDKNCVSSIFNLGYKFLIVNLQVIIINQSTNFLISNVANPVVVAQYDTSMKYLSIVFMMQSIIISPLWPAFTDAYVVKDFTWMKLIYKKMTRVIVVLIIAEIFIILPLSGFVYKLWIGDELIIPFEMSLFVAIYICTIIWNSLHTQILNGIGHVKLQTIISVLGLIIFIGLSLFLSSFLGAYGILVSMIIITLTYSLIYTIQVNKILEHKVKAESIWIK